MESKKNTDTPEESIEETSSDTPMLVAADDGVAALGETPTRGRQYSRERARGVAEYAVHGEGASDHDDEDLTYMKAVSVGRSVSTRIKYTYRRCWLSHDG
jgi:hypothetical protein